MTDVDDAIAEYRRRMQAEAELAESDLDELEEHLRELTDELRTTGMSAAEAASEAARRLGDPRQLAREHARVRSPFGVPLSAGRARSAAVIFVLPLIAWVSDLVEQPDVSLRAWFELGAFVIIAIALAARVTWARPIVLGVTVQGLMLYMLRPAPPDPLHLIMELGLLAFVAPWRRKEVSPAAITLALQIWAYGSATSVLTFQVMARDGALLLGKTCGTVALACAATACIGTVLRARWSAIASGVSALALFGALGELFQSSFKLGDAPEWRLFLFGAFGSGAIAATIAAIFGWRTTRSLAGTFST